MSQNAPLVKSAKFRPIDSIMKDPSAHARLSTFIDEVLTCKAKVAVEQQNIKALREAAVDELKINPKLFNAYVSAAFNNDYQQRKEGLDEQVSLLEFIMGEVGFTKLAADEE